METTKKINDLRDFMEVITKRLKHLDELVTYRNEINDACLALLDADNDNIDYDIKLMVNINMPEGTDKQSTGLSAKDLLDGLSDSESPAEFLNKLKGVQTFMDGPNKKKVRTKYNLNFGALSNTSLISCLVSIRDHIDGEINKHDNSVKKLANKFETKQ